MRMIRLPATVTGARSICILMTVCLLVMGLARPGICVEVDGESHLARTDHLCCDSPPPSQGVPEAAFDEDGSAPVHGCMDVSQVQSTLTSAKPDRSADSLVLQPCVQLQRGLFLSEASALESQESPGFSELTPLSTVRLRL